MKSQQLLPKSHLASWLKSHHLSQLLPKLKEEIDDLDDFKSLDNESEVDEFVNELNINSIEKTKLKTAISAFIGISSNNKCALCISFAHHWLCLLFNIIFTNIQLGKHLLQPKRTIFPEGVHLIPFQRSEYKLCLHNQALNPGQGFKQNAVSIKTTIRKKNCELHTVKQRAPQKLFADKNHKIILICGKTGAGKSTLINSMMNYIYNVQYNDKFRLRLIEEQKKKGGDADSCTDHISSYRINKPKGGKINYDLTIIDTPGFGDCRGVAKDMQILEEFKYVFDKILNNIDGICFVVKSADNRLDAAQTYVFNNILNLWAKDVADNIFILMTFADGKPPNCIDALNKHIVLKDCHRRYKINNSAFIENPINKELGVFDKVFWKMGMKCFDQFFAGLNDVKPTAINLSTKVLRNRDNIQSKIHDICVCLGDKLQQTQEMERKQKEIEAKMKELGVTPEVVWYEYTESWVKKPSSNRYVTHCTRHNRSCHPSCPKSDKRKCCMMNSDGYCTACSCPYTDHISANYEYILERKQIRKSNWDINASLRDKYIKVKSVVSESERTVNSLKDNINKIEQDVENKLVIVQMLKKELQKIALKQELTTFGDYIDQLIENANNCTNRDCEKIKLLKILKKQETVMGHLHKKYHNSSN